MSELERLTAACARVEVGGEAVGTAYLVGPDLAVTCAHVTGASTAVRLVFPKHIVDAYVLEASEDDDTAVLALARPVTVTPVVLGDGCEAGAAWTGHGAPFVAEGAALTVGGTVRDPRAKDPRGRPAVQLQCNEAAAGLGGPLRGLSGGPVMVSGHVVGHVKRAIPEGTSGRAELGVVYAVPMEGVRRWRLPSATRWAPSRSSSGHSASRSGLSNRTILRLRSASRTSPLCSITSATSRAPDHSSSGRSASSKPGSVTTTRTPGTSRIFSQP